MKSVLAADLAVLRSESKLTFILPLIYMAIGLTNQFFRVFCAVMMVTLVINVMAYNERSGFDRGLLILPVSRRDIILARYIAAVCLAGGALVIQYFLCRVVRLGNIQPQSGMELLSMLGMMCLYVAIIVPMIIRLGVEKGRTVYIITMVALACGASLLFVDLSAGVLRLLAAVLPVLGILSVVASCLLAIRMYEAREF